WGRSFHDDRELLDWRISPRSRDKWNSSQAYQSPLSPLSPVHGTVSKRRHSLDMGSSVALATDAATTVAKRYGAVNYAKRLSVIWTRRSQSLHGMLSDGRKNEWVERCGRKRERVGETAECSKILKAELKLY
uniref:Uncharacterized protein n=1 Tax=Sander lucioperca TaxID=283035 RepID=A0A8D0ATR4_SANLU